MSLNFRPPPPTSNTHTYTYAHAHAHAQAHTLIFLHCITQRLLEEEVEPWPICFQTHIPLVSLRLLCNKEVLPPAGCILRVFRGSGFSQGEATCWEMRPGEKEKPGHFFLSFCIRLYFPHISMAGKISCSSKFHCMTPTPGIP